MNIEFTEKELRALQMIFEDMVLSKKKICNAKLLMPLISAVNKIMPKEESK